MRVALIVSFVVIILDQLTKWLALQHLARHVEIAIAPFLNLVLVYNRGAAFGFLNDAAGWQNVFFIALAFIASGVILYMLYKGDLRERMLRFGLALILGGAIGNVIDRFVHGHVIDFVDVYYKTWHWPAFNLADSAISIGAVLLIADALGIGRRGARLES